MRTAVHLTLFLASASVLVGCGSGGEHVPTGGLDFVDVTGTVAMTDGKPLKSGTVYFNPAEAGKGREESCVLTDGKFALKMATGKYKVAFDMTGRTSVPAKYTRFETAQLDADVKAGTPLAFTLK